MQAVKRRHDTGANFKDWVVGDTTFRFFLRKTLGTRYGPVGTRFSLILGTDDNFL